MKKTLSILLSITIVLSTIVCMMSSAQANVLNGNTIADGEWKITANAGGVVTKNTSAHSVSFTGTQYQTMYTKITGLTSNSTYKLTFDVSPTIAAQVWLLSGDADVSFIIDGTVPNGAQSIGSIDGTTVETQFTAKEDSYYIFFRNALTTASTTSFTFSNFKFEEIKADDKEDTINIANSDWKITPNAGGTVAKSNNTVSFTGTQYQTMYTKLTGLTPNSTYKLNFEVSPTIAAQVWLLSGDAEVSFIIDGTVPNGAKGIGSINGTTAETQFTAQEDSCYIFFRNALATASTTSFTFSNFKVEEIKADDDEDNIDIANSDWKITPNAGGTVAKSNNTVKFTGTQSQTMYTKLTGLTPNDTYKLTFEATPAINAQVWTLSGDATVNFIIDGTVPDGAASVGTINGASVEVQFTATEATQYIFIRNVLTTSSTTEFTFSNFAIEAIAAGEVNPGDAIADGDWNITKNAGGTVSHNKTAHTVSFTGAQFQTMYTKLTGLIPDTTYKLTFEASPALNAQVWLLSGDAEVSFIIDGTVPNGATNKGAISGTDITFQFVAEEETQYIFFRNALATGATTSFTLGNFHLDKKEAGDIVGEDVVNGEWTLGEGGKSTTNLVGTEGWGKFYGANGTVTITDPNSCRTSFTKVIGFIPGETYELVFSAKGITGAAVVLADDSAYIDGNYQSLIAVTDKKENVVNATVDGNRYTVCFTAKNNYVYLTVKNNAGTVTLSDFIFDPVSISASAKWGGMVTVSPSDMVAHDTEVTFSATPNIGNYFVGWYDGETLVSTETIYSVVAKNDISLNAVFSGKNYSSDDIFAQRGYDGTFENGTIPGWYATHYNAADASYVSFCNYTVSNNHAYEGNNSLRLQAYHRCSILPLKDLSKNTNYRLSFYVLYEDNGVTGDQTGRITTNAIIDALNIHIVNAEKVYSNVGLRYVKANSGWYRVDMYFNTGDATNLNYELYYGSEDYATGCAYIDNMTLSEYQGNDDVLNADFSANIVNNGVVQPDSWMSDVASNTDNNNAVLKLDKEQTAYQILNTSRDTLYTVTFKAKGNLRAAAVDLSKKNISVKNLLSSVSYVDTNSTSWKEYSFDFYTNNHIAVKLMFEGLKDGAMVDDIKISKAEVSAGGIIENIDFESERFNLSDASSDSFSLYKKQSAKDNNVLSGETSLKFSPSGDKKKDKFIESFMSYQTLNGVSYTVTFNYKASGSGDIYLSPDAYEKYGVEQGYTYSLGKGWKRTEFHFTAFEEVTLKAVMAAVTDSIKGDVYFDDITFKVRLPLIYAYDLEKTYCDAIFNAIDYTGFEFFKNDGNMGKLPKGFEVIKSSSAQSGNNIMTVKAGSKKIFAFNTVPNKIYEFAVSLKGNTKTKGSVAVTVDAAGKYHYSDTNNVTRSKIIASNNGEWKREAFSFFSNSSGITYVVIECSGGTMEIDDMMLFETKCASLTDNNDYTIYKAYNFKNPSVKIYNGGFTEEELNNNEDSSDNKDDFNGNPNTGDSKTMPVGILFITLLLASMTILITKKGGEQANEN